MHPFIVRDPGGRITLVGSGGGRIAAVGTPAAVDRGRMSRPLRASALEQGQGQPPGRPGVQRLLLTKSHMGDFVQGQQGAIYTVIVSNPADGATSRGRLTVAEVVPPGLTLVAMAGQGWQCTVDSCTRNDALEPGQSYPPITVTMNVAIEAPSPQVNTVTLTRGWDKTSASDPTTILPAPPGNTPPVADAGSDQTVAVGTTVTLDGSRSSDVDGDALSFSWTITSIPPGSAATLADPASVRPTFEVDLPGTYVVQLIVNDGVADSEPDTVVISTVNSAPVADAGPDQTVGVGQLVTLDGSGSSDVDGDPLTFQWSFLSRPAGSAATLSDPAAVHPTFAADQPGIYEVQLVVHDGLASSAPDVVVVTTVNSAPVAHAGPDQTVFVGDTVALDGSGSTDVDGDPLTFSWSFTSRPPESTTTLSDPTAVMPTFVADRPGTYVLQLIVHDGQIGSAPDTVRITTQNSPPVADAGPDQTVVAGQLVLLDGSGSWDADGDPLLFTWSLTVRPAGSTATLSGELTVGPSFIADLPGTYLVQLVVNDGIVDSEPDTVEITTTNSAPVANAGPDQLDVAIGSPVTLDGSASSDADGHPLTYNWSLIVRPDGTGATLSDATAVFPTFTPDVAGDYVAQLIVHDGLVDSAPDTVLIRATGQPVQPTVTVEATIPEASEEGPVAGEFTISRTGPTDTALTVHFTLGGTATTGVDYETVELTVVIPIGQSSVAVAIVPIPDDLSEGDETVILTLAAGEYVTGTPDTATVTIADAPIAGGGTLVNGANHAGTIAVAGETHEWTFTAEQGDYVALSIGLVETFGGAFSPWIRLISPTSEELGSQSGGTVSQINLNVPATGTYTVIAGSRAQAANFTGTGSYLLTLARVPAAFVVPEGDEGGPLTNGQNHAGFIHRGDLDLWTFTATAGDYVALSVGSVEPFDSAFSPWIRLISPTGQVLGSQSGGSMSQIDLNAPITGTYTVIAGTRLQAANYTGTGNYLLGFTRTFGASMVSVRGGDGLLADERNQRGSSHAGNPVTWSVMTTQGGKTAFSLGAAERHAAFRPWIRLRDAGMHPGMNATTSSHRLAAPETSTS